MRAAPDSSAANVSRPVYDIVTRARRGHGITAAEHKSSSTSVDLKYRPSSAVVAAYVLISIRRTFVSLVTANFINVFFSSLF